MDQKNVLKYLKLFSLGFIITSLIEFIDVILLSTVIRMNIYGYNLTLFEVFFNTGLLPIESSFLLIFLMITPLIFIALGLVIFKRAKRDIFEMKILSKFILVIGLFLLLGSFIKMVYTVFLGNSELDLNGSLKFEQALYNPLITPFIGAVMWIYLYSITAGYLISGLIFGGVGLKWILTIEKENSLKIKS